MKLKTILYSEQIAEKEKQLNRWMQDNADIVSCLAIRSGKDAATLQKRIEQVLAGAKADCDDCLYILQTQAEWDAAKELGIAALPYVPAEQSRPESFSGAWIVVEGFWDIDFDFFQKAYERAHHLPWTILKTERCILREFSMEDLAALFDLYAQADVTEFLEPLFAWDEEKAYEEAYIENMYRYYGYGMWLVCKKETGEIIGRAGFEHRDYGEKVQLEMGYLISPKEQKKGYATEVCRALLDYAEEHLDFPSINCLIREGNTASVHLAEKLGFTLAERLNTTGETMLRYTKYCFFKTNKI